jgi:hypothetical protein
MLECFNLRSICGKYIIILLNLVHVGRFFLKKDRTGKTCDLIVNFVMLGLELLHLLDLVPHQPVHLKKSNVIGPLVGSFT